MAPASVASDGSHISDLSGFSALQNDSPNPVDAEDTVHTMSSFKTSVFGALYIVQKAKPGGDSWLPAIAWLCLDTLQLLLVLVRPELGWDIDHRSWWWKAANWIGHLSMNVVKRGHNYYNGVLYFALCTLAFTMLLTVWAGAVFHQGTKAKARWPMQILRLLLVVVLQLYYVAILCLLMVTLDCRFVGSLPAGQTHGTLRDFPTVACSSMPQMADSILALVFGLLLFLTVGAITFADAERNPTCIRPLAAVSSSTELRILLAKTAMVVVAGSLETFGSVQAVLLAATGLYLPLTFLRTAPHLIQWSNHARVGLYSAVAVPAVLLLPMRFADHALRPSLTRGLWMALGPAALMGFCLSWICTTWRTLNIREALRNNPTWTKAKLVYRFANVADVEFGLRVMRRWQVEDPDKLVDARVAEAELIMKLGLEEFGGKASMTVLQSNFLIHAQHKVSAGFAQAQTAKSQSPTLADAFNIFVREQLHASISASARGGAAMDLNSFVEFERSYRIVLRTHKAALLADRQFWRMLLHNQVSFHHMAGMLHSIANSRAASEKMYRSMLERYPKSEKLVRSYARYVEDVHNNPWSAVRLYRRADKLEIEAREVRFSNQDAEGGEGIEAVVNEQGAAAVINAAGIIQMANKVLNTTFGWRKGELERKNLAVLLPAPYSLADHIKALSTDNTMEAVGLHRERYVLPVQLTITKVSGSGDDATFVLLVKVLPAERGVVRVWVLPDGCVASVDAQFCDVFGAAAEQWIGRPVNVLTEEPSELAPLIAAGIAVASLPGAAAIIDQTQDVRMVHRFRDPIPMQASVALWGTEGSRILVISLRRTTLGDDLLMVSDHRGALIHISSPLVALLGYASAAELVANRTTLDTLMPQPWSQLHKVSWMASGGAPPNPAPAGCRASAVVHLLTAKLTTVPAMLSITARTMEDRRQYAIGVTRATVEAGEDQRCLKIKVDASGIITSVSDSPVTLFGFSPSTLVGQSIASCIDVLRGTAPADSSAPSDMMSKPSAMAFNAVKSELQSQKSSVLAVLDAPRPPQQPKPGADTRRRSVLFADLNSADPDAAAAAAETLFAEAAGDAYSDGMDRRVGLGQVLTMLAELAVVEPGLTWRVGVHSPHGSEHQRALTKQMSVLASGILNKQTKPAVMQVSTIEHQSGAVGPGVSVLKLHLWRADMVCGVLEVDGRDGTVAKVTDPQLHPPGLLLGVPTRTLQQQPISHLLAPAHSKGDGVADETAHLLSCEEGKRGGMKDRSTAARVGPPRPWTVRHADGRPVQMTVQAVPKLGTGRNVYLVLRLVAPERGDAGLFMSHLFTSMGQKGGGGRRLSTLAADISAYASEAEGVARGLQSVRSGGDLASLADSDAEADDWAEPAGPSTRGGPTILPSPGMPLFNGRPTSGARAPAVPSSSAASPPPGCPMHRMPAVPKAHVAVSVGQLRGGPFSAGMARAPSSDSDDDDGTAPAETQFLRKNANGGARGSSPRPGQGGRASSASSAEEDGNDEDHTAVAAAAVGRGDAASDAESVDQAQRNDVDAQMDFRRGKRLQKLVRLVTGPESTFASNRWRWHTYGIWAVLLLAMLAFFVSIVHVVTVQITFVNVMINAAFGVRSIINIATSTRVIDVIHSNIINPLYGPADLPAYEADLASSITEMDRVHRGIYLGFNKLQMLPDAYGLSAWWNMPNLTTHVMLDVLPNSIPKNATMSLWEQGNQYLASAREVQQNQQAWATAGSNLTSHRDFYFIQQNMQGLFQAYKVCLDSLTQLAASNVSAINSLQFKFLYIYGMGLCLIACCYGLWLLRAILEQRYRLFSVFLAVPQGFVRQLALKEVHLGDDASDDSDDDAPLPTGTGGGASAAATGGGASSADPFAGPGGVSDHATPRSAAAAVGHVGWRGVWGLWAWWIRWVTQMKVQLQFWRPLMVAGTKRSLQRNARDRYTLITPYLVWLAVNIAIAVVGILTLHNEAEPVEVLNLLDANRVRYLKVVHEAHEINFATTPASRASNLTAMKADLVINANRWTCMNFGAVAANQQLNPVLNKIKQGLPFYSRSVAAVLYQPETCHRPDQSTCLQPGTSFYQVSHSGLDGMVQRYLDEVAKLLIDNVTSYTVDNTRLAYLWTVTKNDQYEAMNLVTSLILENAQSFFSRVRSLYIILAVLACTFSVVYIVMFSSPYLRRVIREARLLADLLSQLPNDVAIEELVQKMVSPSIRFQNAKHSGGGGGEDRPLLGGTAWAARNSNGGGGGSGRAAGSGRLSGMLGQANQSTASSQQSGANSRENSNHRKPLMGSGRHPGFVM